MIIYTEGEKASNHKPKIDCVKADDYYELRVYVEGHPNRPEHSIKWIEVYFEEEGRDFNPVMLARAAFSEYTDPDIRIRIKPEKGGKIVALAYCNKHGLWSSEAEI